MSTRMVMGDESKDHLEPGDIPSEQECEGPVHWYQQLVPPSKSGRSVETTPYDPSEKAIHQYS
jgi:hypothetical protein